MSPYYLSTRVKQKNHKRKTRKKISLLTFLIVLMIVVIAAIRYTSVDFHIPGLIANQSNQIYLGNTSIQLGKVSSKELILLDRSTDSVIASKDSQKRIYPASLTKIMTAIIAIENSDSMSSSIVVPTDIYDHLYAEGASLAGFLPGEKATVEDLIYGILLPSGAECCETFAKKISGGESGFVALMNKKAAQLGMKNTNFTNCTGLHDTRHYSTVEDISILLKYALKNPEFREVFTSQKHTTQPSNGHKEGFTFNSTMFHMLDDDNLTSGRILGGKTGFTDQAGLCLASLAVVNGKEYILVTAGAKGEHSTDRNHILDAETIYNQIAGK